MCLRLCQDVADDDSDPWNIRILEPESIADRFVVDERTAPPVVHVAGHELTIFVQSAPLMRAMVADIAAAKHRVWLESHIFADDAADKTGRSTQ